MDSVENLIFFITV